VSTVFGVSAATSLANREMPLDPGSLCLLLLDRLFPSGSRLDLAGRGVVMFVVLVPLALTLWGRMPLVVHA
jgi:hypothetical protein